MLGEKARESHVSEGINERLIRFHFRKAMRGAVHFAADGFDEGPLTHSFI